MVKWLHGNGSAQHRLLLMSFSQSGLIKYSENIPFASILTNSLIRYISGLLLSYNFLRNEAKIKEIQNNNFLQNVKLFGKQLLHRYLRWVVEHHSDWNFFEFQNYWIDLNSFTPDWPRCIWPLRASPKSPHHTWLTHHHSSSESDTIWPAQNIGGEMFSTFKISFMWTNSAWIGHGRWHVKCNFSLYSQYAYSLTQSNCRPNWFRWIEIKNSQFDEFLLQKSTIGQKTIFRTIRCTNSDHIVRGDICPVYTRLWCYAWAGHRSIYCAMDKGFALFDWRRSRLFSLQHQRRTTFSTGWWSNVRYIRFGTVS